MPEIPRAQRTQTIPGTSGNVQQNVSSAGIVGDSISQFGDVLKAHADNMQNEDDINEGIRLSAQFDKNQTEYELLQLAKTGKDTYKNQEETEVFLEQQFKTLTKDSNKSVKTGMSQYINRGGKSTRNKLAGHQAGQRNVEIDRVYSDKVEAASVTAYNGGIYESFKSVRETLELQLESGMISKDIFDSKMKISESTLTGSYIDGLVKNNPKLAVEVIDSGDLNEFLTKDQIKSFDGQSSAIKGTIETFKVRDTFEEVSALFNDPTEAINYLQKSGTAKKHELSSAQNNQVIKLFKDQRSEIELAQKNKEESIKLEAEQKKKNEEDIEIENKNQISNDLYKFEKDKDFDGRLKYIDSIPDKYGDLKRKEYDNYEKDLKASKVKDDKKPKWTSAELRLIDRMTFKPGSVTSTDIRDIGDSAESRELLKKKLDLALKKKEIQKNIENRLKTFYTDPETGVFITKEKEKRSIWKPRAFEQLSEEEIIEIENTYATQLDETQTFFEQNPNATHSDAQQFYREIITPKHVEGILRATQKSKQAPPEAIKKLKGNPSNEMKAFFKQTFGYLPEGI